MNVFVYSKLAVLPNAIFEEIIGSCLFLDRHRYFSYTNKPANYLIDVLILKIYKLRVIVFYLLLCI